MAEEAIAITALTKNAGTAQAAGTVLADVATNGGLISTDDTQGLVVRVDNTAGADKAITFTAGTKPPAMRSAAVAVTVAAGTVSYIPLESMKVVQADGIHVTAAAGATGSIHAYRLPA